MIVAPSNTSRMASSALDTTLFIAGRILNEFHHEDTKTLSRETGMPDQPPHRYKNCHQPDEKPAEPTRQTPSPRLRTIHQTAKRTCRIVAWGSLAANTIEQG